MISGILSNGLFSVFQMLYSTFYQTVLAAIALLSNIAKGEALFSSAFQMHDVFFTHMHYRLCLSGFLR
jgi:hypothetical protein